MNQELNLYSNVSKSGQADRGDVLLCTMKILHGICMNIINNFSPDLHAVYLVVGNS